MGTINLKYITSYKSKTRTYYYFRRGGQKYKMPDITDPHFSIRYQELLKQTKPGKTDTYPSIVPGTMNWLIKRFNARADRKKLAQSTIRGERHYFKIIKEAFGGRYVYSISRIEVEDLLNQYDDRPGTTIKLLAAISKLMTYAEGLELRSNNPCMGIHKPGLGEHEQWPHELLAAALEAPDELFRRAVALHYYTGQRTSDACPMPRSAIKKGEIEVRQMKKRGKLIVIPLHRELVDVLKSSDLKAVTILENQIGGSLKPGAFRRWCMKFCKEQGVKGYSPHGLRKNAVSALLELDCTTAQVASITDQSLATIEKYARGRDQLKIARKTIKLWSKGDKSA